MTERKTTKTEQRRKALILARRIVKHHRFVIVDSCAMKKPNGKPDLSTLDPIEARRDVRRCDRALAAIKEALR